MDKVLAILQYLNNPLPFIVIMSIIVAVVVIAILMYKSKANLSLGKDGLNIKRSSQEETNTNTINLDAMLIMIARLVNNSGDEVQKRKRIEDHTLVEQLNFLDKRFDFYSADLLASFKKSIKENYNIDKVFTRMYFEQVYESSRVSAVKIIKRNHLADLDDKELVAKNEEDSKIITNSALEMFEDVISEEGKDFFTQFATAIKDIMTTSLTNARALAVERDIALKNLKQDTYAERVKYITTYLKETGATETQVASLIAKLPS